MARQVQPADPSHCIYNLRKSRRMTKSPLRIVIVGGVAGGASAATRARRCNEQAEIILLEKDDYVSFANCGMPYHIGGEIPDRSKLLVATKELLERRFRLDVRPRSEVIRIDRAAKAVTVKNLVDGTEHSLNYDKLILSPGASPFVPPMEGTTAKGVFTLRNIADMDRIRTSVDSSRGHSAKQAVVIGAGFIGLEMVEQLVHCGYQVSLAELMPQILPPMDPEMVAPLYDELLAKGVNLELGNGIRQITADANGCATGVELQNGTHLAGSLIILGMGVRPNTHLAIDAGLQIGRTGGISTNQFLQTSDPDIYAVGDACEYMFGPTGESMRIALAGPANRAGRLAGEHAATGHCGATAPVMGTAVVRVFDQTAAMTGLSMKAAIRSAIAAESVTVIAGQHAGYYPGATPITLKLVYAPDSGRVLGAQAVGRDGVDKRIDVLATAMAFKATVRDLTGLDLAYAPPYGSAKDPVHQAAFTACNQLDGLGNVVPADADLSAYQIVDVRTPSEIAKTPLTGCSHAIAIPVDDLRHRLTELDASKPTIVSCGVGVRGHVAERILVQSGFASVGNLSGGATLRRRAVPPAS
jgi:NADPH-dependent 2,4-dienoyl-CoA reductase/sulfur reductase-like enzyme/rhodanese-related sulfurtransferase